MFESFVLAPLGEVQAVLRARLRRLTVLRGSNGGCGIGTLRVLRIRTCPGTDGFEIVAGYDRYEEPRRRRPGSASP